MTNPSVWAAASASQGSSARHRPATKKLGGVSQDSTSGTASWSGTMSPGDNGQWCIMTIRHQTLALWVTLSVSSVPRPLSPGWSVICEHFQSISIKSSWLMLDHFTAPKRRYWELEVRHNWLTGPLTIPPRLMAWNLTHTDNGPGSHRPMVTDGQARVRRILPPSLGKTDLIIETKPGAQERAWAVIKLYVLCLELGTYYSNAQSLYSW